jgi:ABC-type glycerol-3-phosphate transport system substrate-binding protein
MIILSMVLCACALVVACRRSAAPLPSHITIGLPSWYAPEEVSVLGRAAEKWRTEHEGCEIEFKTLYGKREALLEKVMLSAKRGDFADAVLVRNEWIGRLAAEKLIGPLPDEPAKVLRENALPALMPAISDAERVWAVPFDADALVLWRNSIPVSPVRRAPAFPATRSPAAANVFFASYFCEGGELIFEGRMRLDRSAARAALEAMVKQADRDHGRQTLAAMDQSDVFSCLASGGCAETVGGSWERGMLAKQSTLGDGIQALPFSGVFSDQPQAVPKQTTLVGGWSFVLLRGAGAGTCEFLVSLFDAASQSGKLHQNSLLPVRREILSDPWFVENRDGATFKQSLENGRALPLSADLLPLADEIAVMLSEIFLAKKTPDQALEDAQKRLAR